jgi:hypothetical protein
VPLLGVWDVGCAPSGGARPEARLGMSGTDRAGDGPDAIPDVPRRETAAGVDRGTILTEARARREFALAYRATVDAVYAQAELDAGARRPGDSQAADCTAAKRPDTAANGTGPAARGPAGTWRLDAKDRSEPRLRKACREHNRTHDLIIRWKHR